MTDKKKIAFYGILSSGHLNLCSAVASTLLNLYPSEIDVYFFVDQNWAEKLSKVDSRFKFETFEYKNEDEKNFFAKFISQLEPLLSLSNLEKVKMIFNMSLDNIDSFIEKDKDVSKLIKKLKPDFILCDFLSHMPSVVGSKIPYSFIISAHPSVLDIEGFPYFGLDCGIDEKERIKAERLELTEVFEATKKCYEKVYKDQNLKYDKDIPIYCPRSDNLSIYSYPKELDYFDDGIREKYKLLQVDAPIVPSRIPPSFELPEEFSKLPGKIIYVSLGSLFSLYHTKLQKLIDVLATLPYKYIVSKGPAGEKINFPDNRFIGENFVNQLAVLQVVDMMIAHGGNNTFTECFYFGVPSIIFPVMADQVNNAKRIEETGFGFQMNLLSYTDEELKDKIEKVLNNDTLIEKTKKVGQRIRKENSLEVSVKKFYETFTQKFN
uniref:UDP-glycosyltransferase n=1 Tax=Polyphagotarsonemus latus TaxID=1204166 RepID=A0AAN0N6H0_9ACAR